MIKLDGQEIEITRFSDGTSKILCIPEKEIRASHTITWLYDGDEELFTLVCVVGYLRKNGVSKIYLQLPYVPNARMDRTERDGEVHTLKSFGDFITSLNFSMVEVFDPHSSATDMVISPIRVIKPTKYIQRVIDQLNAHTNRNLILYYPDKGACYRYNGYFPGIGMHFVYGEKERNWDTTKIEKLKIQGGKDIINGRNILMIDDICASGGTLMQSARELKKNGAKDIFVYASHTEKRLPETELAKSGLIKGFYTTNSLLRTDNFPKEEILSEGEFNTVIQLENMWLYVLKVF